MKPGYLGDCLDFYKRWFLAEFFPNTRLAAVPMLTEPWPTAADKALYCSLLGVQVIQDNIVPNAPNRSEYFDVVMQAEFEYRDIFFDPDTGLRIGPRPKRRRFDEYLFGHEINDVILPIGSTRVAVIYDQSIARGSESEFAELKVRELRALNLYAFAYSAQVAMVVVSRDQRKIDAIHQRALALAHLPQDRVIIV